MYCRRGPGARIVSESSFHRSHPPSNCFVALTSLSTSREISFPTATARLIIRQTTSFNLYETAAKNISRQLHAGCSKREPWSRGSQRRPKNLGEKTAQTRHL